jgi:hypothetical protein
MAVTQLRPEKRRSAQWTGAWISIFILLVLMVGFRFQVGGDWLTYLENIDTVTGMSLQEALTQGDPAYSLLNWLAAETGLWIYFTNTVCAALFTWGLLVFCRAQPRPWLALVVAIPYLVTVVAMGYTRQGTAIGLAMLGLVALSDRKILWFVVFVVLAATFHKSAVILMPLAILAGTKRRIWTLLWVCIASVIFYELFLENSVETLKSGYLEAQYQSQGAAIFLWYRRRFEMPQADRTFWTWMSYGALGFTVLLVVSPSSTAVDRVALYWIPLQLFVLSRLPNAIGNPMGKNKVVVYGVVAYSAAVLFVWLFFAQTAFAWLPYQFYPLVWLFQ